MVPTEARSEVKSMVLTDRAKELMQSGHADGFVTATVDRVVRNEEGGFIVYLDNGNVLFDCDFLYCRRPSVGCRVGYFG